METDEVDYEVDEVDNIDCNLETLNDARKTYRQNVRELLASGEIKDQISGIYYINNNGNKLFQVLIDDEDKQISIYTCPWDGKKTGLDPREENKTCYRDGYEHGENDDYYTDLYFQTRYESILVPKEHNAIETEQYEYADWMDGNSVLVKVKQIDTLATYIYIGRNIYQFTTNDNFVNFYSPIFGNISFPFGIGNKFIYLFEEKKYFPINLWSNNSNPYTQYYSKKESSDGKKWKKKYVKNLETVGVKKCNR
jgi:hypothetical protein